MGHGSHTSVVQKLPPACPAQVAPDSPMRCPLRCAGRPCQLRVKMHTQLAKQLYRVRKVRIYFPRSLLRDNEVRMHEQVAPAWAACYAMHGSPLIA